MKILMIGLSNNMGGIERFALNYIPELTKNKIKVDFLDIYGDGLAQEEEFLKFGSTIHKINKYSNHPISSSIKLINIIKKNDYDIVHINQLSCANILITLASLYTKKKVIVHSHNSGIPHGNIRKLLHNINAMIIKHLKIHRLACGEKAGQWMFKGKSFDVVPNAINLEDFKFNKKFRNNIRKKHCIDDDTLLIGFIGRLCEQKNPLFILEIAKELLNKSVNYKILILGTGELEEIMQSRTREYNLSEKVIFCGNCKNANEYYSAFDILVLPSKFEGLPLVGIEAQAANLNCVFSNNITYELNITDRAHFCSIENYSHEFLDMIVELSTDKSDRNFIPKEIENKYSISKCSKTLIKYYQSLI